jgi:hypothetical protein
MSLFMSRCYFYIGAPLIPMHREKLQHNLGKYGVNYHLLRLIISEICLLRN